MKFSSSVYSVLIGGVISGVTAHSHHDVEKEVPLHEREYSQDSPEELERKWSFEVSQLSIFEILGYFLGWC